MSGFPFARSVALVCALSLALWCGAPALAAPFVPSSDSQVLATVPARASDPRARELLALRQAWQRAPQDLDVAVAYARRCFEEVAAEGDPRHVGHAQAALKPWFGLPDPPAPVRVLRAQILQFDHRFGPALVDLDAVLRQQPDNGDAWAWRTAILMVQADYPAARRSCDGLAAQATPLIATACRAQVDAATGQAAAAAQALRSALAQQPGASPEARLWTLTRLAETEERRGAFPAAEAAFRDALALGLPDVYLQAAYADFLLDRGRPAEVLALLKGRGQADVLLLVHDLSADPDPAPLIGEFFAETDRPRVLVVSNKCDLCGLAPQQREDGGLDRVWLSARGGQGIDLLVARLCARAGYQPDESTFIARTRHLDALRRTQQHLDEAHEQLTVFAAGELVAESLRLAQNALGEITGAFSADDLLGRIFGSFCIGK